MERTITPISFLILSSLCLGGSVSTNNFCNIIGDLSGVICVTENHFKLTNGEIYGCPPNTWCTNAPEICTRDGLPECRFMNECPLCRTSNSTSVCVSKHEYVTCIDGAADVNIRACDAYCGMLYDDDRVPYAICTNFPEHTCNIDKPTQTTITPTMTTEPATSPPEFECPSVGKFPVTSDPTCQKYYYCYADQNINGDDVISYIMFVCPNGLLFDAVKLKCVPGTSYVCENI